jgi:hypothetical protein
MRDVGDGFADDFVRKRRCVAFAKEEKAEYVRDWIPLLPLEIDVRRVAGEFFHINEQGRDGVGDHGATRAQDAVFPNANTFDMQLLVELRGIRAIHFEKDHWNVSGETMNFADQRFNLVKLEGCCRPGTARNNP